jgi:purine nucleosidase
MPDRRWFLRRLAAVSTMPLALLPAAPVFSRSQPEDAGNADKPPLGPRRKLLLDTDIGSDIDDAVALAYLLRQPACDLLGITTVTGDAGGRAELAKALCAAAGRSVPVYPGAEAPLVIPQRQLEAPQTRRLNAARGSLPEGSAVEFLREVIRANPGEIDLLAVGPMTNIARLFERDPHIPGLLNSLVLMAGKYSDYPTPWGPTEWNAIVDPHAISRVFAEKDLAITAFGLDITWQVFMEPGVVAQYFRGDPLLEMVLDWSEVWFEERKLLHFHDPLAAASLFTPGLCTFDTGDVAVDLQSGPMQGVTEFRRRTGSHHKVAVSVDAEAFFEAYFGVFQRGAAGD